MKKIFTILLAALSFSIMAQTPNPQPTRFTSGLLVPNSPSAPFAGSGSLWFQSGKLTLNNGSVWQNMLTETLAGTTYVPLSRTITINGTALDLSADRSWSISTNPGTVTSVTSANSNIAVSSTTTAPVLTLASTISSNTTGNAATSTLAANATQWKGTNFDPSTIKNVDGSISYFIGFQGLSNSFYPVNLNGLESTVNKQNTLVPDGLGLKYPTVDAVSSGLAGKQNTITVTSTGTSGPASISGSTLNIPNYVTPTPNLQDVTNVGSATTNGISAASVTSGRLISVTGGLIDFALQTPAAANIMEVPTGTKNVLFSGMLSTNASTSTSTALLNISNSGNGYLAKFNSPAGLRVDIDNSGNISTKGIVNMVGTPSDPNDAVRLKDLNSMYGGTKTVSNTYSVNGAEATIRCDATSLAFTVTLPTASSYYANGSGLIIRVKKIDSSANAITISATGTTIDGSSTKIINTQYSGLVIQTNGTTWDVIGTF